MSSGKQRKKSNTKTVSNRAKRYKILSAVPGLIMCAVTLLMLFSDLFTKDPESQYDIYPAVFRIANIVAVIAGVVFICMLLAKKEGRDRLLLDMKRDRTWIFFAIFLLLILISTCVNGWNSYAVNGIPYRYISVFNMIAFVLIYMGVSAFIMTDRMKMLIFITYAVIADIIALSALYDSYLGQIPAYHAKKELSAIFFNGNHYGYFLAMAIVISLGLCLYTDGRTMILGAVSAVINLVVLAINHSLGSILAVVIVFVSTAAYASISDQHLRRKIGIMVGAGAVLVALSVITAPVLRDEFAGFSSDLANIISGRSDGSEGHNRLALWSLTCEYISEKPMLGHGCEGISLRLYEATARSNPHNEILTYAAYYGIPAAIAYFTGIVLMLTRWARSDIRFDACQKIACMAAGAYFVASMTGVAMFYLTPFFFIFLGMTLAPHNN